MDRWIDDYGPNSQAELSVLYRGSGQARRFDYREALRSYLEGRAIAKAIGDREKAGIFSYNLAALYFRMNATRQSREAATEAMRDLDSIEDRPYRANLLLHRARLAAREGDWQEAALGFRAAAREADLEGNTALAAEVLDLLGREFLRRGELAKAETTLTEAFRLRKMTRDAATSESYQNLGLLRLAQGDAPTALRLMEAAMEEARKGAPRMPAWSMFYCRARALAAMGQTRQALEDLRSAAREMERATQEMPAADALRVSSETTRQEVYSAYVETAAEMYFEAGDPNLAIESLEAAEKGRALEANRNTGEPRILPQEYAEALDRLAAAYSDYCDSPGEGAARALERARLRLTELKLAYEPDTSTRERNVDARMIAAKLPAGRVLMVFHLGEARSYLWSITRGQVYPARLPRSKELAERIRRFVKLVHKGASEAALEGAGLYETLFGELPAGMLESKSWLVVADGELTQLPLAALVVQQVNGVPAYLAERHSIQMLPGIWAVAGNEGERAGADRDGPLVGVADAIYNTADSRWMGGRGTQASPELARLPGTARELEACRNVWERESGNRIVTLTGAHAVRQELEEALEQQPQVLHLATHMTPSPGDGLESLLALGLDARGRPELVGPEWIAAHRVRARLVMMTGCRSGSGETIPGEGLMGLSRAWLLAGADAVAATRWPVPDDGAIAESFYRHWMKEGRMGEMGAAEALQLAQIEMIGSATFRARPNYWAGYFVIGRDWIGKD